jgi:hypothetical protein
MADKFNLDGFSVDTNNVCTAASFIGPNGGDTSFYNASGAISLTDKVAIVTAAFATPITLTLANGFEGQTIKISAVSPIADTVTVTPNSFYNGTSITFDASAECVDLTWSVVSESGTRAWVVTSISGATIV